jgi:hypothetical protein
VRQAELADWAFIRDAWLATYRAAPAVQGADRRHYEAEMARVFTAIVPTASARIACDPSDDETRLAFVVYRGSDLHYAYVTQDLRHFGIVPTMLESQPSSSLDSVNIKRYNFTTYQGIRRLKPQQRGWLYCPCFTWKA